MTISINSRVNKNDIKLINEIYSSVHGPEKFDNTPQDPSVQQAGLDGKWATDDSSMMQDVANAYQEGMPFDQQSGCIEAFFDENAKEWQHVAPAIGLSIPFTGSDEESHLMIKYALHTWRMPDHIREMLKSWYTEGF